MKHGVIVGGTGAGKSTFLENIIAQDLTRRFGARRMTNSNNSEVVLLRDFLSGNQL